jgi:hypothetical protein
LIFLVASFHVFSTSNGILRERNTRPVSFTVARRIESRESFGKYIIASRWNASFFAQLIHICTLMLSVTCGCGNPVVNNAPLRVDGPNFHDFGTVADNESPQRTFVLLNESNDSVEIKSVRASCKCLVFDAKRGAITLLPGAKHPLTVKLSSGESGQVTTMGRVIVMYKVSTDPNVHTLELYVRAARLPEFNLSSEVIDFGTISRNSPVSRSLMIDRLDGSQGSVTDVRTSSQLVEVEKVAESNSSWTYRVTLKPHSEGLQRHFRESIVIRTDSKRTPSLIVSATGLFEEEPIQFRPESIIVGSNQRGKIRTKVIVETAKSTSIVSARSKVPSVQVAFDPAKISTEHELFVTIDETVDNDLFAHIDVQAKYTAATQHGNDLERRLSFYRFRSPE